MGGDMGVETMALIAIGSSVASGASGISGANKEAKSMVAEGNIVTANKAKEIKYKASSQKVSFLNSGLALDGTPAAVIAETFKTGLEDVGQIQSNYNRGAKNVVNKARTQALTKLASSFTSYATGNMMGDAGGMSSLAASGGGSSEVLPWLNSGRGGYGSTTGFNIN